jgi:hypothetical protein
MKFDAGKYYNKMSSVNLDLVWIIFITILHVELHTFLWASLVKIATYLQE